MADTKQTPPPKATADEAPIVAPPASFVVHHDHKVVLFTADGKALVRRAGF